VTAIVGTERPAAKNVFGKIVTDANR